MTTREQQEVALSNLVGLLDKDNLKLAGILWVADAWLNSQYTGYRARDGAARIGTEDRIKTELRYDY